MNPKKKEKKAGPRKDTRRNPKDPFTTFKHIKPSICSKGFKCKDPQCSSAHPECKVGNQCSNQTCGFSHPDGRRYTGGSGGTCAKISTTMCWKKEKCDDDACPLSHPPCQNGAACTNFKCGFLHPDGRRYTGPKNNVRTMHNETFPRIPGIQSSAETILQHTGKLYDVLDRYKYSVKMDDNKGSSPVFANREIPVSIAVANDEKNHSLESVRARGQIIRVEEGRSNAWVMPPTQYFAKAPAFYKAMTIQGSSGVLLSLTDGESTREKEMLQLLMKGDWISMTISMDPNGNLIAKDAFLEKVQVAGRSEESLRELFNTALKRFFLDEEILLQVLNHQSSPCIIVGEILIKTQPMWRDTSKIVRGQKLCKIFAKSTFLHPQGMLYSTIESLSKQEVFAARDMLGFACIFCKDNIRLYVQTAIKVASCLRDESSATTFLAEILQLAAPPRESDSLCHFSWWQLPSVPLHHDLLGSHNESISNLQMIPSVMVGEPYPSTEAYVSTYLQLHRADCFFDFVQELQHEIKSSKNGIKETKLVVGEGVTVCDIHVSNKTGEMDIQLYCSLKDRALMRHNNFALTNLVCISLRGDFKDEHLIWGTVTSTPIVLGNSNRKEKVYDYKSSRIMFGMKLCSKVNVASNEVILEVLQTQNGNARLVENPVSFVLFEPVLNALRLMWRPGYPITLPFEDSLLRGEMMKASDTEEFLEVGKKLKIPSSLDQFQLDAYNSVARSGLALVQGPPGCGKSHLGSRLCRILSECSGRVLVVTFKNHALDEMLLDVAKLFGPDGNHQIIRIGNNKKTSQQLRTRTLSAVTSNDGDSSKENTQSFHNLRRVAKKCNSLSNLLRDDIRIDFHNFCNFAGSVGVNTIQSMMGWKIKATEMSFDEYPVQMKEQVNAYLHQWAKPALDWLKKDSINFWREKSSDGANPLDTEQKLWIEEENDKKELMESFEGFDEVRPQSLMGVMITAGITANTELEYDSAVAAMDVNFMNSWGLESKKEYVLSILRLEFSLLTKGLCDFASQLGSMQENYQSFQLFDEVQALRSVPIIGSTILGALLNMDAISASEPTVLLLEESGEVPEPALIALMSIPSLKRCIMIGDHQQLRPSINSHELRKYKKLDVSCFERLVKLDMNRSILKTQNRMREDVLTPVTLHYPMVISNIEITQNIHPVPWLVHSLFWWICESRAAQQNASWYNEEQGRRAVALSSFLVTQQATKSSCITILVPYTSQLFYVRMLLRTNGDTNVNVSTIDQYQGDENEVIILCLVRCDSDNPTQLGFLGQVNRMVVATSRQKKALVIIGSKECFSTHSEWNRLQCLLQDEQTTLQGNKSPRIGSEFPICCPRHPNKVLKVPDSRCFPSSGCGEGCNTELSCGHKCSLKCHPGNMNHGKCKQMVHITHEVCLHSFQYQCHAIPKKCPKEVIVTLPCGHKKSTQCGLTLGGLANTLKCTATCKVNLSCGHAVWIKCGDSVEAYSSTSLNSCPSCVVEFLGLENDLDSFVRLKRKWKAKQKKDSLSVLTEDQANLIVDATVRAGFCEIEQASMLKDALFLTMTPSELVSFTIPNESMWDPNVSEDDRQKNCKMFSEQQLLWSVMLQETGILVPKDWQKHPLTLIAGMALSCVETRKNKQISGKKSEMQTFIYRLQILKKAQIFSANDLIEVIKEASLSLYKAISEHPNSGTLWYHIEEGILAKKITNRLLLSTRSGQSVEGIDMFNKVIHSDWNDPLWKKIRDSWCMPTKVCDVNSPPYEEVAHDFLYRDSLAGSYFISLDLKSADFHILRLAAPEIIKESTWASWVEATVPDLVKRVPFLTDMKPLRVRVLGKALHKKNAALQCHCIRILARILLIMANTGCYEKHFTFVERVFQFSCDELCIKLKETVTQLDAFVLSQKIESVLNEMNWGDKLPVRIEIFKLIQEPLSTSKVEMNSSDNNDAILKLGHPTLRKAAQFVDLPAVHDVSWSKPDNPALLNAKICNDSFFIRCISRGKVDGDDNNLEFEYKKLPLQIRPQITLEQMSKLKESRDLALSYDADANVPNASLSATASSFIPGKSIITSTNVSKTGLSAVTPSFVPEKTKQLGRIPKKSLSVNAFTFIPKN